MRYLYLHGFASGPQSRKAGPFREKLSREGIALEVPDLAHGDFEHLTISSQLSLITQLLNGEPARLVGSSMGGYLAALYASLHPEVDRLVLIAPAFGFASHWRDADPARTAAWRESGWLKVYHYADLRMRRVHYGLLEDALKQPPDPVVHCPVRVFHGLRDTVVPIEFSRQWTAANPSARLQELESDHELLDVADQITTSAIPFLIA